MPRHHVQPKMRSWAVALNVSILGRKRKEAHDACTKSNTTRAGFISTPWMLLTELWLTLIFIVNDSLKRNTIWIQDGILTWTEDYGDTTECGSQKSSWCFMKTPNFIRPTLPREFCAPGFRLGSGHSTKTRLLFLQVLKSSGNPKTNDHLHHLQSELLLLRSNLGLFLSSPSPWMSQDMLCPA